MECEHFDGNICLNTESNYYGCECDIDCEYEKEKELKEICERLKEREIITDWGRNLTHTKYYILLNLNIDSSIQLDELLIKEFKKAGYNAFTDDIGDEVFIKLK